MQLEFYSVDELKKMILMIVGKFLDLNIYKIFFFGSRVKGSNFPRADIDIGIEGPAEIPIEIKLEIQEELDKIPTLYKIDFVDFNQVTQDFKTEALKYKEIINI